MTIAQAGKTHTVPENLIKPCVKKIIECMFDKKQELQAQFICQ